MNRSRLRKSVMGNTRTTRKDLRRLCYFFLVITLHEAKSSKFSKLCFNANRWTKEVNTVVTKEFRS
jgi:hypothetical protein